MKNISNKVFLLFYILLIFPSIFAQQTDEELEREELIIIDEPCYYSCEDTNIYIFTKLTESPKMVDGTSFGEYIKYHYCLPPISNDFRDIIVLEGIICCDGQITNIQPCNTISYCDVCLQPAIDVVKSMSYKVIPGKYNGKFVSTYFWFLVYISTIDY